MHPWGHFLCCDFLDTHEVCILALGTVHGCMVCRGDRVIILFSPWDKSINFCFHNKLSQNFSVGGFVWLVHQFPFDHRS